MIKKNVAMKVSIFFRLIKYNEFDTKKKAINPIIEHINNNINN